MYSLEHINYLKKIKKNKITVSIFQILIFLIFIILWQILSNKKIINTFIFSSPKNIINTIVNLFQKNSLINHIYITILETIISFLLASFIGLLIAALFWYYDFLHKIFEPYLTILNSLPKVALGPIIIIWFGSNIKSIIFMALLISLIITIINLYEGFVSTDKNKIKLMKSLNAKKSQIFFKLILPSSLNNIISILKINISMNSCNCLFWKYINFLYLKKE